MDFLDTINKHLDRQEYVYMSTTVVKTGRTASRQINRPNARRNTPIITEILYEIAPSDPDLSWVKWVKQEELFVINK